MAHIDPFAKHMVAVGRSNPDRVVKIKQGTICNLLASLWDCEHFGVEILSKILTEDCAYKFVPDSQAFNGIQRQMKSVLVDMLDETDLGKR